jgi:hypothetical protein
MEEDHETRHGEPHDEIARLETRMDELMAKIENCRKFVAASRVAMALGGLLLLAGVFGVIRLDPVAMTAMIVITLGGIVLFGSNRSTAKEAAAELASIEARRNALINRIAFRVVSDADQAELPR